MQGCIICTHAKVLDVLCIIHKQYMRENLHFEIGMYVGDINENAIIVGTQLVEIQ